MPPPPPPPPAPPPGFGNNRPNPAPKAAPNRGALLSDIRGGMKLKKTVTNDRSTPQIGGDPSATKPTIPRRSSALNKRLREMLATQPKGKVGSSGGGSNGAGGDRPSPGGSAPTPAPSGSQMGMPANLGAMIASQAGRLRSVNTDAPSRATNGPMRALPSHNAVTTPPAAKVPPPPPQNTKPSMPLSSVTPRPFRGLAPQRSAAPAAPAAPTRPYSMGSQASVPSTASVPLRAAAPTRPYSGFSQASVPGDAPVPHRAAGPTRPYSVVSQASVPGDAPVPLRAAVSTSQLRDPFRSPDSGYSPSPQGWRRPPSAVEPSQQHAPARQRVPRSPSYNSVFESQATAASHHQPPPPPPPASKPMVERRFSAQPAVPPPLPPNKPYATAPKPHAPAPPALPSRQRPPSMSSSTPSPGLPDGHEYANGAVMGVAEPPVLRRQLSNSTSSLTAGRAPPPPPPRSSRPPPPPPASSLRPAPRPPSGHYGGMAVGGLESRFSFRPMVALPMPRPPKIPQKRYPSHRTAARPASMYNRQGVAPHPPARPPR